MPTAYTDINQTLGTLHTSIKEVLKDNFVGLYLYGSLASGDFNPSSSDIDFVTVTKDVLNEEQVGQLELMHKSLLTTNNKWMQKLEGSYISKEAFRRYDPQDQTKWPTLNEKNFYTDSHATDWIIQRHIVREMGVVIEGPDPKILIDPVSSEDIKDAVRGLINGWWTYLVNETSELRRHDYQAFAILSMCRVLYTLETGTIASKAVSAQWAKENLDIKWKTVIDTALSWGEGVELNLEENAAELVRFTIARANQ